MLKLSQYFINDCDLAHLTNHTQHILIAQKAWQSIAPAEMRTHTQAGEVRHKRLTIYCDNGAVATKIKMQLPTLLSQLQKQGLEVTAIRVVVQVKSYKIAVKKPHRIIDEQGAEALKKLAESMTGSALGASLERLASRTNK